MGRYLNLMEIILVRHDSSFFVFVRFAIELEIFKSNSVASFPDQ